MKILYTLLAIIIISTDVIAQKSSTGFFNKTTISNVQEMEIPTIKAEYFDMNLTSLIKDLNSSNGRQLETILLPLPDGTFDEFQFRKSVVMSEKLSEKYPNIKTFIGTSIKNKSNSVRFDISPNGFHAMMFTSNGTVYIDPVHRKNKTQYQSYYKRDFLTEHKGSIKEGEPVDFNPDLTREINKMVAKGLQRLSGTELRTYRLAITATGEYTSFHGGTVEGALSAIVTTMNRVNGIYEREVSIRMVLIDNTDQLIFTDAEADGFSNNDANSFIDEVQARIDEIIGDANYDIGHGVSTGGGGLAGTGPCISGRKASGITGSSEPVGDPYDVDFVAHEIGHQFSAAHTFNGTSGSCSGGNRSAGSAYEPGSGTTIMAYAGICGAQNIQSNSDPYFHSQSFDQIIAYSTISLGNNCATVSFTGNNAPVVDAGIGGFTIPISTPFKLNGNAIDPDGDVLTYNWEQFDLGTAGEPDSPEDNAPLFRAFSPVSESYRVFPQISDLVNNTNTLGEILPSYTRSLKFRLVARDNKDGGGGVDHDEISFDVSDNAGPFLVTEPNTEVNLIALSTTTVTWDIANTNIAPINCQNVNILLSVDGGLTYPHMLVSNTNNDGSAIALIPDVVTNEARIKVEAADNIFFDISNSNFNILASTEDDYSLFVNNETITACAPDDATISIQVSELGNFTTPISLSVTGLPAGYNATFDTNPINVGNSATLTISNTSLEIGTFNIEIKGESNGVSHTQNIDLTILEGVLIAPNPQSPADNGIDIDLTPTMTWNEVNGAESYQLQIALDSEFTNKIVDEKIINELTYQVKNNLGSSTTYYWRVRADNSCGDGAFSSIHSFNTKGTSCVDISYAGDPVLISEEGTPTVSSTIEVVEDGVISDLNVKSIVGLHTWVGDLTMRLIDPTGITVTLFSQVCGEADNFNLGFDDDSSLTTLNCPPTDQNLYKPSELLSAFNGKSSAGTWTLEIADGGDQDGGELTSWSLEICFEGTISGAPNAATSLTSTSISSSQIDLSWTDNASDETGYLVERSIISNKKFEELKSLEANTTNYSDLTVEGGITYFYRVKALKDGVSSAFSNESIATTPSSVPNAPTNLNLESKSSEHIKINWKDNSNTETEYLIERSVNKTNDFSAVANYSSDVVSYVDVNVNAEETYFYRVKAVNAQGGSSYSNELEVTVPIAVPTKATNFVAMVNSSSEIALSWNDNATDETEYKILRSESDNDFIELITLPANTVEHIDQNLEVNTRYSYRLFSTNAGGNSDYASVLATTLNSIPMAPSELTTEDSDSKISLFWKDNSDNEAEFIIDRSMGDNTDFAELKVLSSNITTFIDFDVEKNTSYVYRIYARNNGGVSDYSNELTTGLITGIEDDVLKNNTNIYPNPSTGIFIIKINDISASKYDIRLTDILGKFIKNYSVDKQDSSFEQKVDLSNQPKGIYLMQISNGQGKSTHRLMKE